MKKSFEGYVNYENEANDYFYEWVTIDGKGLIDMLKEMGWEWKAFGKPAKVRVTIEVLELGDEFKKEGETGAGIDR